MLMLKVLCLFLDISLVLLAKETKIEDRGSFKKSSKLHRLKAMGLEKKSELTAWLISKKASWLKHIEETKELIRRQEAEPRDTREDLIDLMLSLSEMACAPSVHQITREIVAKRLLDGGDSNGKPKSPVSIAN